MHASVDPKVTTSQKNVVFLLKLLYEKASHRRMYLYVREFWHGYSCQRKFKTSLQSASEENSLIKVLFYRELRLVKYS